MAAPHPVREDRISAEEGFRPFTINSAKTAFKKGKRSIEPGKLADFALHSVDSCNVSVEESMLKSNPQLLEEGCLWTLTQELRRHC